MEKKLKLFFQQLLSLATGKFGEQPKLSLVKGRLRKRLYTLSYRMRKGDTQSDRIAVLFRSIYESKRCWCILPAQFEEEAMIKHKNNMSSHLPIGEEERLWLQRAVDVVIPPETKYVPGTCCPTYKASYECKIAEGGNHSMYSLDKEYLIGLNQSESFSEEQEKRCLRIGYFQKNNVIYQAIPEPGKFRIITKGPGAMYTGLRRLQSFLLKRWKLQKFSTFTEEMEERIRFRLSDDVFFYDGPFIISGDYDSATDALAEDTTLVILDRILENLGLTNTLVGVVARKSFLDTTVEYPDGELVKKTRGQLMGHPLSFPLLCIANLSTYMRTFDRPQSSDLSRSGFCINGDDIIFRGTISHYNKWRDCAGKIGLQVNEVKTYTHQSYGLINSYFFNRNTGRDIRYVPYSLSIGHKIKSEPVFTLSQASKIYDFLLLCPEEYHSVLKRNFFKRVSTATKKVEFKVGKEFFTPNFFLPRSLGGLGLRHEGRFRVTRLQKALALYLFRHPSKAWLIEKFDQLPTGAEDGIKKFLKIKPKVNQWLKGSKKKRPVLGPLPKEADPDLINKELLMKCIQSTQWKCSPLEKFSPFNPLTRLPIKKWMIRTFRKEELPNAKTINSFNLRWVLDSHLEFLKEHTFHSQMKRKASNIQRTWKKFHLKPGKKTILLNRAARSAWRDLLAE